MARQPTSSERLTSGEAAALLGITEHSLRTWRVYGKGPKWHTLGPTARPLRKGRPRRGSRGAGSRPRIFYLRADVLAYINGGKHGEGKR